MEDILWLEDLDGTSIDLAGAKMARLGELRRSGITVPEGFVITTDAHRDFMHLTGMQELVAAHLGQLSGGAEQEQLEAAADAIRGAFSQAVPSERLAEGVAAAYDKLSYRCYDINHPVAVRSSAVGEDSAGASFAGQFDTHLGVIGTARVLDAVRSCWSSVFSARSLAYQLERGIRPHEFPMATGVMRLVHTRSSGVAFSIDPVTAEADRIVIECSWGLGEALVQGLVTPDHVEIAKQDRRILDYRVAHKTMVSVLDHAAGCVRNVETPKRIRDDRVLDDEEIRAVAEAVLAIEDHYGYPVDVEWVVDRHRRRGEPVTIVQARPETVHTREADAASGPPRWDPVSYAAKYGFGAERR